MLYCTEQDLIDRYGLDELIQLTDRSDPPTGVVDSPVVDKAIADASAMIDGYLQSRYSLPLTSVPVSLERIACDLARFYLYEDAVTDTVQKRYDAAIQFLKAVANGQVNLGSDASNEQPESNANAEMESGGRIFGREDSTGFI